MFQLGQFNWQYVSFDSSNGLASNMRQAITFANHNLGQAITFANHNLGYIGVTMCPFSG